MCGCCAEIRLNLTQRQHGGCLTCQQVHKDSGCDTRQLVLDRSVMLLGQLWQCYCSTIKKKKYRKKQLWTCFQLLANLMLETDKLPT